MNKRLRDLTRPVRRIIAQSLYHPDQQRPGPSDDYEWNGYRKDYERQLAELAEHYTQKLNAGDFAIDNGHIRLRPGLKPLHPNHACLYETIGVLASQSAIEVGCGGGDHLHNLGVLYPAMSLRGFDRSPGQLALLRERSPNLAALAAPLDLTMPPTHNMPTAEIVYSQAVVMHIHAGNGHLVALANMFRMSTRRVVLMENWWRHWFMDDIRMLHDGGMIDWPRLNLYFRRYDGAPHIIVVSKEVLPFEQLTDYRILLDAMNWKPPPGAYPADGQYTPRTMQ